MASNSVKGRASARCSLDTFDSWLERYGVDALAKKLAVTPHTIRNWRARRCEIGYRHIKTIHRLAQGRVSYDELLGRAVPTNGGRR